MELFIIILISAVIGFLLLYAVITLAINNSELAQNTRKILEILNKQNNDANKGGAHDQPNNDDNTET